MKKFWLFFIGSSIVMLFLQIFFLYMPISLIQTYNNIIQPFGYIMLAVVVYFGFKGYQKPSRVAYQANLAAILSVVLYIIIIIAIAVAFGGGRNVFMLTMRGFFNQFWVAAVPLVAAEMVRFKLLKATTDRNRTFVVISLTLLFTFTRLNVLRVVGFNAMITPEFLFESLLPAITASGLVTLVALKGTLFSTIVISFVFNLWNIFTPILPDLELLVLSLILCGIMFLSGILFAFLANDVSKEQRRRMDRALKYSKGYGVKGFLLLVIMGVIVAFFLNVFPVYPVVILTESMTGYIDRGSLVIMRRIPENEVLARVQVDDVLHYNFRHMEFVHRVVGFTEDSYGNRLFITQGDANPFPDPTPLDPAEVIGRPLFVIPFIGYPNIIIRAMTGRF